MNVLEHDAPPDLFTPGGDIIIRAEHVARDHDAAEVFRLSEVMFEKK